MSNINDRQKWLDQLQVGDEVLISNRYHTRITKVDHITPTRRIKAGKITFNALGDEIGADAWNSWSIREVTDKDREHIFKSNAIYKLKNLDWHECTTDQLKKILEIVSKEA